MALLLPPVYFAFSSPLSAGLGLGHRVLGYRAPAPLLPWGAASPVPHRNRPAGPSSASSSPRTRGPPGKLGEWNAARRKLWDLAGNNSWGRRCGLLCAVSLFSGRRLPSERTGRGRQTPSWWISTVPSPLPDSGGERCVVGWGGWWLLGAPPRPGLLFCICRFHFCPCQPGPPALPSSRLCALMGARVCGVSSAVLTNNT